MQHFPGIVSLIFLMFLLPACSQFSAEKTAAINTTQYCPQVSAAPAASCELHQEAHSASLWVRGTLLLPEGVLEGGEMLIENGTIIAVGCGLTLPENTSRIDCRGQVISPGLINLHEHLKYSHHRTHVTPADYDHRHEWRLGLNGKPLIEVKPAPQPEMWARAELRHLLAGETAVVGSGQVPGLTRDLEKERAALAADHMALVANTFPLSDGGGLLKTEDCDYPNLQALVDSKDLQVMHLAEGTSPAAHNELRCLSHVWPDDRQFTLVHGVASNKQDVKWLAKHHHSLVWSPRSNLALYGATADIPELRAQKVMLAIGTDWSPTGSLDLPAELRCARDYALNHWALELRNKELWQMATTHAATAAGLDKRIGTLQVGAKADFIILDGAADPYAAVVEATAATVRSVFIDGHAQMIPRDWISQWQFSSDCKTIALDICGQEKSVCGMENLDWPLILSDSDLLAPLAQCKPQPDAICR